MITDKNINLRVWEGQPKDVPTSLFSVVSPNHGDFFF